MATVKDFVRKTPSELHGPAHACDATDLSPKEFLFRVMRDRSLPITTRMEAAAKLLPLTESVPRPTTHITCTIVIEGIRSEDLDGDNRNRQSNSASGEHKRHIFMTTPGMSYIEKTLERIPLSEIIEIVSRTPEHLLPVCTICNHPMMYPCSTAPGRGSSDERDKIDPSTLPCVTRHTGRTVH